MSQTKEYERLKTMAHNAYMGTHLWMKPHERPSITFQDGNRMKELGILDYMYYSCLVVFNGKYVFSIT